MMRYFPTVVAGLLCGVFPLAYAQDFTPPTGSILSANATTISGLAADDVALDRVELSIRNSSTQFWNGNGFASYTRVLPELEADGTWEYTFPADLPPDDYVVVSFAFDSSQNVEAPRAVVSFTVEAADIALPTASIVTADSSTITGVSSDNVSVDRVELAIRNSKSEFWTGSSFGGYARVLTQLQSDDSWTYTFANDLPPDEYVVVTFAFDSSENVQDPRDVVSFTVNQPDIEPPIASIASTNSSTISGVAADNDSVDRVELAIRNSGLQYWNGTSFGGYSRVLTQLQNDDSWTYTFASDLPPDEYVVVTFAFDSSENVQDPRDAVSFTVNQPDIEPPTASILSANSSTISGLAADNILIDRVELAIRNSNLQFWNGAVFDQYDRVTATLQTNGTWEYVFPEVLPPDSYNVTVFPFDSSGNVAIEKDNLTFTVNRQQNFISTGDGFWSNPISLPSIPVSAANLPDGRILTWSAQNKFSYQYGVDNGRTYTTIFNPTTGSIDESLVSNTNHDMFCPGASMLSDGKIMVTGGSSVAKTSLFDPNTGTWSQDDNVNIPRAYNANTTLQDGSVLTLGGSWAEETLCRNGVSSSQANCPDKKAEIWNPVTGWSVLSGISADSLRTDDTDGLFRSDNHMWLFPIAGGNVLHAGPSKNMHMLDVTGNGSITPIGLRADDNDAMNGNAVMYDIGKLLIVGGAPDYEFSNATNNAFVLEVQGDSVTSRRTGSLAFNRAYHNSVVLPNGEVVVIGGQSYAVPFTDDNSAMNAELWNPITDEFRQLSPLSIPRNYHSFALLLNDGRIIAGGGGLCGNCSTNHADVEIYTPPYLLDENNNPLTRPSVLSAPAQAAHGSEVSIQTNAPITSIVLIRQAVATHSVNNDQRRIPLSFTTTGTNTYQANIPADSGIAIPGNYMLFALNENGTPSISKIINIR